MLIFLFAPYPLLVVERVPHSDQDSPATQTNPTNTATPASEESTVKPEPEETVTAPDASGEMEKGQTDMDGTSGSTSGWQK